MNSLRAAAGSASEVIVRGWLAEHGEDLLECLAEVQTKRARFLLYELCERAPAVAGVVTMLMRGTPDQAVRNIAMFSPDLAARLHPHLPALEKLQVEWGKTGAGSQEPGVRSEGKSEARVWPGIGDRVYHRARDLFGKVVSLDYGIPQNALVKYELPWDPKAPPEAVPVAQLAPSSEWE